MNWKEKALDDLGLLKTNPAGVSSDDIKTKISTMEMPEKLKQLTQKYILYWGLVQASYLKASYVEFSPEKAIEGAMDEIRKYDEKERK